MKTILIWLALSTPVVALDYNLGYQPALASLPTPSLTSTPVRQMQAAASAHGMQYTAAPEIFLQSSGGVPPASVYSAPPYRGGSTVTYVATVPDRYVGPPVFFPISTGICTAPSCSNGTSPASTIPSYWQPYPFTYPTTVAYPVCTEVCPSGYSGR